MAFLADPSRWEFFDLKLIGEEVSGYAESLFDGRYIYYGPERNYNAAGASDIAHAFMLRYDTTKPFPDKAAWEKFDLRSVFPEAGGSVGMGFDGQYVYFAPFRTGGYAKYLINTLIVRYDTKLGFSDPAAWASYDLAKVHPDAGAFVGAAVCNNRLYMTPLYSNKSSLFMCGDLTRPLDDPEAWSYIDMLDYNMNAKGYIGTQAANGYVYYSPCYNDLTDEVHAWMLRHDASKPINDIASWEMYDASKVHPNLAGYDGMAFDSRHIYHAPYYRRKPWGDLGTTHSHAVRFDTLRPFGDRDSWEHMDIASIFGPKTVGFIGAGCDGRRVYYAPVRHKDGYHGQVVCYDNTLPFMDPAAWESYDLTTLNPRYNYYDGHVVNDGTHMYFVACGAGAMMARFRHAD